MKTNDNLPWPPFYRVKENARAKHVILRVGAETGLVLTVPTGFNPRHIPRVLDRHRDWIEKALAGIEKPWRDYQRADLLPQSIVLEAVDTTWAVTYRPGPVKTLELAWTHCPPRLQLQGDFSDVPACCRLLRRWLREEAKRVLRPWVHTTARQTGLSCTKVKITTPKTRWGSYSSQGTVSLNAALLFLPRKLVEMVITHELCHSLFPRHDRTFWNLVARHEPDYVRLEAALKSATDRLPLWYQASFL
ncbi:MAG: M48 family metallopeptidase [Desulfosoma sp.]|uniref:M48 family metallopeptidase n=1 Tax=Desulfosoma sp. TaxID=2603217 RepID=UPI00404AA9B3